MIAQMFFTLVCTVLFCLGFHLVSKDGYALGFIERFFNRLDNKITLFDLQRKHLVIEVCYYLLALFGLPFALCITCMSSIWGVTWFVVLNSISLHLLPYLVLNCFAAAFLQTFIWQIYVKHLL